MSNSLKKYIIGGILVLAFIAYVIFSNENAMQMATNIPPTTPTPTSTSVNDAASTTSSNNSSTIALGLANGLTVGSTGTQVTQLQQALIDQGYLTVIPAPTGYFGVFTQAALQKFQAANGVSPTTASTGKYKDGTYTGSVADAFYGKLQVAAVIKGGAIVDIQFLGAPSGGHSSQVSDMAEPVLKQEAIAAQTANVDIVSGATQDSEAFQQSLAVALSQAKN